MCKEGDTLRLPVVPSWVSSSPFYNGVYGLAAFSSDGPLARSPSAQVHLECGSDGIDVRPRARETRSSRPLGRALRQDAEMRKLLSQD